MSNPNETEHHTEEFSAGKKTFILSHRENINGRFLRIIENNHSRPTRSNMIIIPEEGVPLLSIALAEMMKGFEK